LSGHSALLLGGAVVLLFPGVVVSDVALPDEVGGVVLFPPLGVVVEVSLTPLQAERVSVSARANTRVSSFFMCVSSSKTYI
jgi:hypothetical protein